MKTWDYLKTEVHDQDHKDQHSFISHFVVTHAPAVPREQVEKEAKIIAAAPELLIALKNLCDANPNASNWNYPAAFSAAQDAIKKATE